MIRMVTGLLIILQVAFCGGEKLSKTTSEPIHDDMQIYRAMKADTVFIDLTRSIIRWKGTKMRKTGKHEGIISLRDGYLLFDEQNLVGGRFHIDMSSMEVTDMPPHETIPRKRLIDHLKSTDFFDTQQFPFSTFEIKHVQRQDGHELLIDGDLTMKGITNSIQFMATFNEDEIRSNFEINRFNWDVGFRGSWADRTLVDRNIELTIELKGIQFPRLISIGERTLIRSEIEHQISLGLTATRTKDIDLYMSLLPADLILRDPNGNEISRLEQRENALRDWSIIDSTLSIGMNIERIEFPERDSVIAYTHQEWKRIMFRQDGTTTDTVLTTQKHRETWKKTNAGWFVYTIEELGGQVFINGKEYEPGH